MGKRMRKDIAMLKKQELLKKYQALPKCSQRVAAEQRNISRGYLPNLLREETTLQTEASGKEGSNERKRQRHGKDREVEDGLWKWFHFAQSGKVPINGPVLMQKAEMIAKQLGHDQFKSSDGWLNRWKKRHDLRYTKLYGEASEAEEAAAMWTSENVHELLKKYKPVDVYNAEETAFYFRALWDSTYVKKSSRKLARVSKVAKDRLTVLVCCNMTGDKHGLLVIGRSQLQECTGVSS